MKLLILVALVGFLLPGEMDAAVTSCYQCTSGQTGCEDPFKAANRPATTCAAGSNYCMKTKAGNKVTSRTCTPLCTASNVNNEEVTCCSENNCNAGTMMSFSAIAIMMSLLMAYVTKGRL